MTYQTITQYNATSLGDYLVYVNTIVPQFTPLMMFALFVITMMATYFSSKRLSGVGDLFGSFAVAGFLTAVVAILLSIITGAISGLIVSVTIVIAIIGIVLLFFSRRE